MDGNTKHLRIRPSDLFDVSNTLDSLADDMRKNLNDMTECVKELTQIWKDKNGVDFVNRYTNEVEPQLSNYFRLVEKHSGFISGAAKAYREFANETARSINDTHYVS